MHLSERLAYEAAVRQQRLRTEISQVDGDSVDDAIWSHNNVQGKKILHISSMKIPMMAYESYIYMHFSSDIYS